MSMDIPYFNSGSLGIAKRRNAALPNSLVQIAKLQTNPKPKTQNLNPESARQHQGPPAERRGNSSAVNLGCGGKKP